jgi:aspartate dehydrogenase
LIGCGTIGTIIAEAVDMGRAGDSELVAAYDIVPKSIDSLMKRLKHQPVKYLEFEQFLSESGAELVVEAASQEAVKRYGELVVGAGKDLMIMSVGALLDDRLRNRIETTAKKVGRFVIVPSGAIGGIDAVKAAKYAGLNKVTLTTWKNPETLKYSPHFKKVMESTGHLRSSAIIFEGSAEEAVKAFPASVNVSAVLSLAGMGGAKTLVRIIGDSSVSRNIHEIEVEGDFGRMVMRLENIPHPENPKTSYLAALSAIETIRSITSKEIRVGT